MGGRSYFKGSTSTHGSFLSSPRKFPIFSATSTTCHTHRNSQSYHQISQSHEISQTRETWIQCAINYHYSSHFPNTLISRHQNYVIWSCKYPSRQVSREIPWWWKICLKPCLNLFGLSYDVDKSSESSFEKPQWYFSEEHYIRKKEIMIINVLNFMIHRLGQNST